MIWRQIRQTFLERRRRPIWIMTFAWVLPVCWIASMPPKGEEWRGLKRTHKYLQQYQALMQDFEKKYKDLPKSIAELKLFAKLKKTAAAPTDGFGQQFDYMRFGKKDFALRSFGSDGKQNTLSSDPDPSLVSWTGPPEEGMHYSYEQDIVPTMMAAPLLAGLSSPSGPWTGELIVDSAKGTRQLLVRNRVKHTTFLLAPHDQVEEFLWLPNGFQITFTATGSKRYRDGVYLWNLLDDSLLPIFDGTAATAVSGFPMLSEGETGLVLSLAGVSSTGPTVLFYATADHSTEAINPVSFHSLKNLRAIRINQVTGSPPTLDMLQVAQDPSWSALGQGPPRQGLWTDEGVVRTIQKEWLDLPFRGPIEGVISAWQTYAAKYSGSPMLPYALWTIAALYGDAWSDLSRKAAKDADILRAFGAEIAARLEAMPLAPRYLRYEGRFVREKLAQTTQIPFRLAEFTGLPE